VPQPQVTFSSPGNAASSGLGSVQVTISGLNFASSDPTPTAGFALSATSTNCASTTWTSGSSVSCSLSLDPQGKQSTSAQQLQVGVAGGISTGNWFTFDAPVATSTLLPGNAPISGRSSLGVNGMNFASTNFSPTVWMGTTLCSSTGWVSGTSLSCATALGGGAGGGNQRLLVDLSGTGLYETSAAVFSFDAPTFTVNSNLPYNFPHGMATCYLTLLGSNFGSVDPSPTVRIGEWSPLGTPRSANLCTTATWISSTTLLCAPPLGPQILVGYPLIPQLTVAGFIGTRAENPLSYDAPVVTFSLGRTNGAQSGEAPVTLTGLVFSTGVATITVAVDGGDVCLTTTWSTGTSVRCRSPTVSPSAGPYTPSGRQLVVTVAGQVGTGAAPLSFDAPVTSSALAYDVWFPSNLPQSSLGTVTISGLNFHVADVTASVTLMSQLCDTTSWTTATTLMCTLAAPLVQPATVKNVMASVQGLRGTSAPAAVFSFDAPALSFGLSGLNSPLSGGATVTISGVTFGYTLNPSPTASVSGRTVCATTTWASFTTLTCRVPPGAFSVDSRFTVSVAGVVGTMVAASSFSFDAPVVSYHNAPNGPPSGGSSVTVWGANFGAAHLTATVLLQQGAPPCDTTSWSTLTSLRCAAPAASVASTSVHANGLLVTVSGIVGTRPQQIGQFSFDGTAACAAVRRGTCSVMIARCCTQLLP
jgi:hypothetical protein